MPRRYAPPDDREFKTTSRFDATNPPLICLRWVTNFLPSYNVLVEVQGLFTFPPQQMPHASDFIRSSFIQNRVEKPRRLGVRGNRNRKYLRISKEDWVIGLMLRQEVHTQRYGDSTVNNNMLRFEWCRLAGRR